MSQTLNGAQWRGGMLVTQQQTAGYCILFCNLWERGEGCTTKQVQNSQAVLGGGWTNPKATVRDHTSITNLVINTGFLLQASGQSRQRGRGFYEEH